MRDKRKNEEGIALFLAVVATIAFVGIAIGMITSSLATAREYDSSKARVQRLHAAKAGVAFAVADIAGGGSGDLGTSDSPVPFGPGSFVVTAKDTPNSTVTITSVGTVGEDARAVRTVFEVSGGVFHHAMFSGNTSRDPTYSLELGGTGPSADKITGDVYSGGGITLEGDATIDGSARAKGKIEGMDGKEGVTQPVPDLQSLDYEANHDVNVAKEFEEHARYQSSRHGGSAWQVDSSLPSHILRMNPSDRRSEITGTEKDDYYLEDPYESARMVDRTTRISLADSGNRKVYYVDGNLWLHNYKTYGFALDHEDEGSLITFVVKGNIYFSDNLTLRDPKQDAVAFIALKDENVEDSGNIYFGDPEFGTLLSMDAFMYAENNFYDQNLQASGSTTVQVNGIMSAGNQVAINRDYEDHHTKLELNFDSRVKDEEIELPGIPDFERSGGGRTLVREICSYELSPSKAK